jgi:hypothetical protein
MHTHANLIQNGAFSSVSNFLLVIYNIPFIPIVDSDMYELYLSGCATVHFVTDSPNYTCDTHRYSMFEALTSFVLQACDTINLVFAQFKALRSAGKLPSSKSAGK